MLGALRSERGQALLEYAVIFPLLMLLLVGIMEFGVAVMAYDSIANAAREGARYGVIRQHHDDNDAIEDVVRRSAMGLDQSTLVITSTWTTVDTIEVEVGYQHAFMTSLIGRIAKAAIGRSTLPLYTMASMRIE